MTATLLPGTARAEVPPLKPYGELVDEVTGFLFSDVGTGGIRTNDNDPDGYPVPPYFYHFAIYDGNNLWSSLVGYPGYSSVSYPAYTASAGIDAFLDYYRYSGNREALGRAVAFADWVLEHRTPPGDLYGNLPYSTQTEGVMGGGWDGDAIMPDKAAMFALRLLRLHDATGEMRFWLGALEIGQTLAATQMAGSAADHGRWPFRVRPSDGATRQDYTSHLVPAVLLFDELSARTGNPQFTSVRNRAWAWLLANPCNPQSPHYQRWEAFYEDQDPPMQTGLRDHYSAHETIVELARRQPSGWRETAVDVLHWAAGEFLLDQPDQGLQEYVPATREWQGWPYPTPAATLQFAWASLLLRRALAGDPLQEAVPAAWPYGMAAVCSHAQHDRHPASSDGRMFTTLIDIVRPFNYVSWYEQNFNTVKYYLALMALDPTLAPVAENHMLAATHEVRAIDYAADSRAIHYEIAGGAGIEVLRVALEPAGVSAAGVALPRLAAPPATPLELLLSRRASPATNARQVDDPPADSTSAGWHFDVSSGVLTVAHDADPVAIAFSPTSVADNDESEPAPEGSDPPRIALRPGRDGPASLLLALARASRVSLTVYDLRGRRIATVLAGAELMAGEHPLRWDERDDAGRRAPDGVYLVLATAADAAAVTRIVRLR